MVAYLRPRELPAAVEHLAEREAQVGKLDEQHAQPFRLAERLPGDDHPGARHGDGGGHPSAEPKPAFQQIVGEADEDRGHDGEQRDLIGGERAERGEVGEVHQAELHGADRDQAQRERGRHGPRA